MCYFKKAMAMLLVLALTMSFVLVASAATSPKTAPTTDPYDQRNPYYDGVDEGYDTNIHDHNPAVVASYIKANTAMVIAAYSPVAKTAVTLSFARKYMPSNRTGVTWDKEDGEWYTDWDNKVTEENNKVTINTIGDGKAGVFDRKYGQNITAVTVQTEEVAIAKNAFKNSKVSALDLNTTNVTIKKNAFKGTKSKSATIAFSASTKASEIKLAKGAFNGLSKKAKILVSKKMSAKEFKKLKKKLKKAGFKGKIKRV